MNEFTLTSNTLPVDIHRLIEDSMILRQLIRLMEREYDTAPYIMLNEKDVKLILGDRIRLGGEKKEE